VIDEHSKSFLASRGVLGFWGIEREMSINVVTMCLIMFIGGLLGQSLTETLLVFIAYSLFALISPFIHNINRLMEMGR